MASGIKVTCYNLELGRTRLDFVAFGGCSNALLRRFSLRNSSWGLLRSINTVYRSQKVQFFHRDISHWHVFSTTMPDAFLGGKAIVLMGVSGAGKSTIGPMLAESFNCRYVDADDYHPQSNKEKMKNGIPLSEENRIPWLETLRDILKEGIISNQTLVLGCSALQNRYREILRCADPEYKLGSNECLVKFILLDARVEVLAARLEKRAAEGKHFMPAKLLQSQINLLQIDEAEGILKVDATLAPHAIVDLIHASVMT